MTSNSDVIEQHLDRPDPWSIWGVRLIALIVMLLAVSLGFMWVKQFYFGLQVDAPISYIANDVPWMPNEALPTPIYVGLETKVGSLYGKTIGSEPGIPDPVPVVPIVGTHYFGDFQLPYAWGLNVRESVSPYLDSMYPSNYPPMLLLLYAPLSLFSFKVATWIFLVLSAAIVALPLWLLLAPMKISYRCLVLVPLCLVTGPMVTMLDRGNSIGLCTGLISCAVVAWRRGNARWCGAFLAAACALTVYPVLVLVVPLAFRRYRFTLSVILSAILANVIALLFIPGGFVDNLRTVIPSMSSGVLGNGSQLTVWSSYSLLPKIAGLIVGPVHSAGLLTPSRFWSWLPSIVYLALVFFIVWRRRVPEWCWGALCLATIQLVLPFSASYTTGWACLAAIWFVRGSLLSNVTDTHVGEQGLNEDTALRIVTMLAIAATLLPSAFSIAGVDGFSMGLMPLLSPLLVVATLVLAMVRSFQAPRQVDVATLSYSAA